MTGSRPLGRMLTVATLAFALVGCSATNPIQTDRPYAASDGVRVQLGDVRAENLLAVIRERVAARDTRLPIHNA